MCGIHKGKLSMVKIHIRIQNKIEASRSTSPTVAVDKAITTNILCTTNRFPSIRYIPVPVTTI
jgi:hypothetical protein